jgi:hypothetical protein
MMIPSNRVAIDMARAELQYAQNDELRLLAQDIIAQQQRETSVMSRAVGNVPSMQAQVGSPTSTSTAGPVSPSKHDLCEPQFNGPIGPPAYIKLIASDASDAHSQAARSTRLRQHAQWSVIGLACDE